jgi:DNA/RNA-binding protein KIN17
MTVQEASMKKERATTSDEQRERLLIAEQIERAEIEAGPSSSNAPPVEEGLKRDDGTEKIVLSLSAKPLATVTASAPAVFKVNPLKPKAAINPLRANPLKPPKMSG